MSVDYAIIGSGPSGQKAAIQAAKLGQSVVVIEKDSVPGGACLNSGTIPSKTFREAVLELTDFYERSFYGKDHDIPQVSINDLNYRLNKVVLDEQEIVRRQFRRNHIQLIHGIASFKSPYEIIVKPLCGQEEPYVIKTRFILIATGSKPRNPVQVPFDKEVIFDSTTLLELNHVPKSMIVLGGGVIGSEYASFFAALGTQVTVIDKRTHMLPSLDYEIGIHLQNALTSVGLRFYGNRNLEKVYRKGNEAVVETSQGDVLKAEVLLYALGREANVDDLNIDNAGLELHSGYIKVNELFQTDWPHIYAVGDVIGGPSLGSTSMEQGRLAARHAFGVPTHHFPTFFPIGIYTIPEISSCGYTEEQLKKLGFQYEVGRAYYYEIARSHIQGGSNVGLFKVIFHKETLEILGLHIIGRAATEVIHIGQVAMTFNAKINYFIDQVLNYPTYAEGYRIAALNGFNKIASK